jgi:hypothetical protein
VWSKALKARGARAAANRARWTPRNRRVGGRRGGRRASQRQEGNGAGDSVRLHRRRKALKGQTPSVDPACNKAGRHGADESVRRLRKPGGENAPAVVAGAWKQPLPHAGKHGRGERLHGRRRAQVEGNRDRGEAARPLVNSEGERRSSREMPRQPLGWSGIRNRRRPCSSGSDPKDMRGALEPMRALVGTGHALGSNATP